MVTQARQLLGAEISLVFLPSRSSHSGAPEGSTLSFPSSPAPRPSRSPAGRLCILDSAPLLPAAFFAGGVLGLHLMADRMPLSTWWALLGICTGVPGLPAVADDFLPPCAR